MNTDALTGLINRRELYMILKREISFSRRHGLPLSLAIGDIDNFKMINDTYGHDIGDKVLKAVAKSFKKFLRLEDYTSRFGGEEFVLVLPNTDIDNSIKIVDRLRENLANLKIKPMENRITMSFGITQLLDNDSLDSLLQRADLALYEAKKRGKNRAISR